MLDRQMCGVQEQLSAHGGRVACFDRSFKERRCEGASGPLRGIRALSSGRGSELLSSTAQT